MKKDILKYKITIDDEYADGEDLGISMIAFTSRPAIMVKGMAFAAQAPKKSFYADEVKMRVTAPVMIPMEIYRCDDSEYYVEFSKEEVEKIYNKFMKNYSAKSSNFNIEHKSEDVVPAYMLESWVVESAEDKAFSKFNTEVPMGTIMMTTQFTDRSAYDEVVKNGQTGYSIEGFLGMKLSEQINNKIKTQQKMKRNSLQLADNGNPSAFIGLPVGKTVVAGTEYTVEEVIANEGTEEEYRYNVIVSMIPVSDAPVEEVVEETLSEEVKEEETTEVKEEAMAEDEKPVSGDTEEVKTELAEGDVVEEVAPVVEEVKVETYSKEELDAKFDELYKMIADIKAMAKDEVVEEVKTEMSIHDRMAAFSEFARKNK